MIVMPVDDSEGLLVNKVRHSHNGAHLQPRRSVLLHARLA